MKIKYYQLPIFYKNFSLAMQYKIPFEKSNSSNVLKIVISSNSHNSSTFIYFSQNKCRGNKDYPLSM